MKKKIVLLVVVLVVLALVVCGGLLLFGEKEGTVRVRNKETMKYEELTLSEMRKIEYTNSIKYGKCYSGTEATLNGKVTRIEGPYYFNTSKPYYFAFRISIEGDLWQFYVQDGHEVLNELEVGDRVEVKGILSEHSIVGNGSECVSDIKITDKK